MKRFLCLLLSTLLLGSILGCHYNENGDILEPVEFCYLRNNDQFLYGTQSGVFGTEIREAAGHRDDVNYLLSMYMRGPQSSHLRSPFPTGCRLRDIRYNGSTICLVLTGELLTLTNTDLTLACAALSLTCLGLSDVTAVRIESVLDGKTFSITLDADSLLLAEENTMNTLPLTDEP